MQNGYVHDNWPNQLEGTHVWRGLEMSIEYKTLIQLYEIGKAIILASEKSVADADLFPPEEVVKEN